jgi:hypothetical protein
MVLDDVVNKFKNDMVYNEFIKKENSWCAIYPLDGYKRNVINFKKIDNIILCEFFHYNIYNVSKKLEKEINLDNFNNILIELKNLLDN